MKKRILITGASGLVGTHLTEYLLNEGYEVAHLGRRKLQNAKAPQFTWQPEKEIIDAEAIRWADAIVHLAGANVAEGRWTEKRKKEIIDSRVKSGMLLAKTLRKENKTSGIFISASGVGWYGMVTSDKIFSENDLPAADFLGDVCKRWENAADHVDEVGWRTVKLRIGVVLAKESGALPKLSGPVKWGFGSALGTGKQWMPWVHIDDLCAIFLKAIEDDAMNGAYNIAASEHVTNKQFVKTVGNVLKRPVFLPAVPEFILKLIFGEMSGVVTKGSRVSNEKIRKTGFIFQYDSLKAALKNLL